MLSAWFWWSSSASWYVAPTSCTKSMTVSKTILQLECKWDDSNSEIRYDNWKENISLDISFGKNRDSLIHALNIWTSPLYHIMQYEKAKSLFKKIWNQLAFIDQTWQMLGTSVTHTVICLKIPRWYHSLQVELFDRCKKITRRNVWRCRYEKREKKEHILSFTFSFQHVLYIKVIETIKLSWLFFAHRKKRKKNILKMYPSPTHCSVTKNRKP